MGRNTREQASELRAVAPLVTLDGGTPRLLGVCTLVTNGAKTIGFSSAQLLRAAPEPVAIVVALDGARTVPVASWSIGGQAGLGVVELGEPFPTDAVDVAPLQLAAVSATVDTRGAPAALVIAQLADGKYSRRVVDVHVDVDDGGGMADVPLPIASPIEDGDVGVAIDGAPLFAWLPADPVLGRPGEVVALAVAIAGARAYQPRAHAACAALAGLDELGRALPWEGEEAKEGSNELHEVVGEIRDVDSGPVAYIVDTPKDPPE